MFWKNVKKTLLKSKIRKKLKFAQFFAYTFFREPFSSPFQRILNQHEILRFKKILKKIFFNVILAFFANFKCICSNNGIFFAKSNKFLFCQ